MNKLAAVIQDVADRQQIRPRVGPDHRDVLFPLFHVGSVTPTAALAARPFGRALSLNQHDRHIAQRRTGADALRGGRCYLHHG